MPLDERSRHELFTRLEQVLGEDNAHTRTMIFSTTTALLGVASLSVAAARFLS